MSNIYVTRKVFTNNSTVGILTMEDLHIFTLEDTMRLRDLNKDGTLQKKEKILGKTAIPSGSYEVIIKDSTRFKRPMPYILDVPLFENIMIHPGNTDKNTDGCLLVGMSHPSVDFVGQSKVAFDKLFAQIDEDLKKWRVWIHLAGGYNAGELIHRLELQV